MPGEKSEEITKERQPKKNRKKEKEKEKEKETVEKASIKNQLEKRALILPLGVSVVAILLIVLLGGFYVVCISFLSLHAVEQSVLPPFTSYIMYIKMAFPI